MPYIITSFAPTTAPASKSVRWRAFTPNPARRSFMSTRKSASTASSARSSARWTRSSKTSTFPPSTSASIEVNAAFFRQNKAAVGPVPFDTAWAMIQVRPRIRPDGRHRGNRGGRRRSRRAHRRRAHGQGRTEKRRAGFQQSLHRRGLSRPTTELVPQARQPWLRSLMISHRGSMLPMGGAVADPQRRHHRRRHRRRRRQPPGTRRAVLPRRHVRVGKPRPLINTAAVIF